MERYCENCGAKLEEDVNFCQECGKQTKQTLKTQEVCPNCGESTEDSENFCEHCGTNLNTQQTVTKNERIIDKYKIPIIIIATVVVIVVIIAGALSFTAKPAEIGTQIASVGAHEFEIPGNFRISPSTIDVDYNGYSAIFSQGYSDGNGEAIYISVMTIPYGVDGESVAASEGGVHKNLMGVNGYFKEKDVGVYTFAFVDGTYLNVVSATSPYLFDEITYLG